MTRTPKQWLLDRDRLELALWGALLVAAVIVRFLDLGDRAFHHDESQDAYFSYTFSENPESYSYNPLLHGPLRFYLTGLNYWILGDSNFTARLAPAYMGTIAVGLPYLLRHQLGRVGAFAAGALLAFGPSFLYYSRFAREDIYLAAIMLAVIVGCFRFVERPRALTLSIVFGLASLAFATKESGLVLCGFIALFFIGAAAVERFQGRVTAAVKAVGIMGWTYAVATLLVVYGAMFTVFFTDSECVERHANGEAAQEVSCVKSVFFGINYWREQQDVARGDDLAGLYPSILVGLELPVVLLGLIGLVKTVIQPTLLRCFLVFYFVATLGFHMWGSERFAWLVLHPLLPLILLAGTGVQTLWEIRGRTGRLVAAGAVAVGALYLAWTSFDANARRGTDPRNMLVSTQSSPQAKQVADQIIALDREFRRTHDDTPLTISIDSSGGLSFPYAWYLRHLDAGYPDLAAAGQQAPTSQVLVLNEGTRTQLLPLLSAYDGRQFDFRRWWVKRGTDHEGPYAASVGDYLTYIVEHKPWSPLGGVKAWFYVRRDAGDLPPGEPSAIPPPTASVSAVR